MRLRTPLSMLSLLAATLSTPVLADDFDIIAPNQRDFAIIAEDITATLNYKALGPAEATGLTGIGVAAFGAYVPVQDEGAWRRLTGEDVSEIGTAGIAVRKGLPFNIDVGGFYTAVPGTDAKVYGVEARYAILPGGIALPALALRAAYTKLSGVDDFDFDSTSVDLSISKGFALLTPYAGIGGVFGTLSPDPRLGLNDENVNKTRVFAGLRLGLGLLDITPEYERIGSNNSYNLLLGLSF